MKTDYYKGVKMEIINILILVTELERDIFSSVIRSYVKNIDPEKIKFDFLVSKKEEGAYEEEFIKLGYRVFHLNSEGSDSKYKSEFISFLRKHDDYKIVHSYLKENGAAALSVARDAGIPVRIAHGMVLDGVMPIKKGRKEGLFTDVFASNEKVAKGLFGKHELENVRYVKNPIDIAEFQFDVESANEIRQELGISSNQLVITTIGRMNGQRNQEFVIDIFYELKEVKNSVLLFVGNENTKKENNLVKIISKMAQRHGVADRVKFLGVRNDINKILCASDILLAPLKQYCCPVSLLEAQASGVMVFASDTISNEIDVTHSIEFISLKKTARAWAYEIMNCLFDNGKGVVSTQEEIKRRQQVSDRNCTAILRQGYDIVDNAKKLQNFYIKAAGR